MISRLLLSISIALTMIALTMTLLPGLAHADRDGDQRVKHVLLISVDGLHALDVSNYVQSHPSSALAELSKHGITYSNARTPANSDSFPGLLALVTGGSPVTTGLFHDFSYDRAIFDPTNTTCSGSPGNVMIFDESIDRYQMSAMSSSCTRPHGPVELQGQNATAAQVGAYLNKNANALFIDEVMAGNELKLKFNNPATDSRTPDVIVQPIYGTIYTGSKAKNAEHGGFSFGDTNVGLIVSNPGLSSRVLKTPAASYQVAPTILSALGLDPDALKSVKTEVLPGLPFKASDRDREH